MGLELKYIETKHFSSSSIDARKEFISDLNQAMDQIESLLPEDLLELATLYVEFFKDTSVFPRILLNCNERYLNKTTFVNTLFFICKPSSRDMATLLGAPSFREKWHNNDAIKTLFDKYCTYNMIDSDHISIDSSTIKDGCGGSIKWPYMFVQNMQRSLNNSPIHKNVGMVFGRALCESLKLSKDTWDTKLGYVLNIHESSLKRMCESVIFKDYINVSYDYIMKEYSDEEKDLPKSLEGKVDKLKTVSNYSKLIKPKKAGSDRIFPT